MRCPVCGSALAWPAGAATVDCPICGVTLAWCAQRQAPVVWRPNFVCGD